VIFTVVVQASGWLRAGHNQPGSRSDLMHLPQVAVTDTPQSMDATGENLLYDEFMIRLYLADALTDEGSTV